MVDGVNNAQSIPKVAVRGKRTTKSELVSLFEGLSHGGTKPGVLLTPYVCQCRSLCLTAFLNL